MPRQERTKSGTGIYHVMLRGINKQDIFVDHESPHFSHNMYHWLILLVSIFATCLFISCESWYSYCFSVNNLTGDSIEIGTTSLISDYKIQIHNFNIRNSDEQGFSVYKDNPLDTIFIIPPRSSFSAIIGWYSRNSMLSVPERDGIVPLWTIIKTMSINGTYIIPSVWNCESKWEKELLQDNTTVIYELNISIEN